MSLNDILRHFRDNISRINQYINIAYEVDEKNNDRLSNEEKEFIVSSAFLKMFISWEEYLETVFIQYLLGKPSINGDHISRYAIPVDKDHAHKIVIGTQKYVDWANHEIIMRLSKLFFKDGGPIYTAIASIAGDLADLKVIRNAAAHISTTTQLKFDSMASRKLSKPVSNIGIAEFITKISPEDPSKTILQLYQLVLDITAENIANNRV